MNKKFSIVCPDTDNHGVSLFSEIKLVRYAISIITGGVSQYVQVGTWYDENGQEYTERSTVLYTVCNEKQAEELMQKCEEWAGLLRQIVVLATVEDVTASFVSGKFAVA